MSSLNDLGQPVGDSMDWSPVQVPGRSPIIGRTCRLEALDASQHAADLHSANLLDETGEMWTYMPYGPFGSLGDYSSWCDSMAASEDPLFYAVVDQASGGAIGVASYLRIEPAVGVIEVGHIAYSPPLQRTTAATEGMYLMMRRVFDELGYRRYEWKCDALNHRSRKAAARLGFTFEGVFRQATVYKNRYRDTAWFAIVDREWPALKSAFERWLATANFDFDGNQKERLSALTADALYQIRP